MKLLPPTYAPVSESRSNEDRWILEGAVIDGSVDERVRMVIWQSQSKRPKAGEENGSKSCKSHDFRLDYEEARMEMNSKVIDLFIPTF